MAPPDQQREEAEEEKHQQPDGHISVDMLRQRYRQYGINPDISLPRQTKCNRRKRRIVGGETIDLNSSQSVAPEHSKTDEGIDCNHCGTDVEQPETDLPMNDRMDIRNRAVFQHSSSQEGGVVLEQDDLVDNGSKDDVLNEVDQADSADMWYGYVGCDHNVEDNTWHIDGNKEGEDDLGQDMGGDSVQNEEMDQGDDEDWHDNGVESGGDDEDDDFQHGDGEEGNEPDDNYQGFSLQDGNLPIYPDAPITKSQSLLLIVSYVLRHGLSDSALDDLLSLMNIHCPNSVPTSKYLLYKSVEDSVSNIIDRDVFSNLVGHNVDSVFPVVTKFTSAFPGCQIANKDTITGMQQ
ncbi:protein PFC0760c-like [Thalassophryne amazonica]|uniref:protein PFC0760c-like n=1 Tax=Thalassophryne amazonica TaxID=390379 RepID=UPI00147187C3|nr:protein PFC0760c-like [Thalassophryne amazonica]